MKADATKRDNRTGSNRPKTARASGLMQQSVRSGNKKKEVASTAGKGAVAEKVTPVTVGKTHVNSPIQQLLMLKMSCHKMNWTFLRPIRVKMMTNKQLRTIMKERFNIPAGRSQILEFWHQELSLFIRSTPTSNLIGLACLSTRGTRPATTSKSVVLSTGFLPVPAVNSKPVTDKDR